MSERSKRISEKIALLRREGKDAKQAAGEAYGMEREGRLRRHGKYVHKGRKKAAKKRSRRKQ
jgi:hypothetical protein